MRLTIHQRRSFHFVLAMALLLGQLAGFMASPRPAAAALSADPNAEIVYIDNNKFIRVLDTQGDPLVQWVSPDAGWDQIVLLDVDDDGDLEILALDKQPNDNIRVALYDPVRARNVLDPTKKINGIPWDLLWEITFAGSGEYVVGGNFDNNIPGDEIIIGFRNGDTSVVRIYNAVGLDPSTQKPTGRDWKQHVEKLYPERRYDYGISGQLDDEEGADELILFDSESEETRLDLFRPDQDMLLTDSAATDSDRFKSGATGQLREGDKEEFVAILTVERASKSSLRSYDLNDDGEIDEDTTWAFAPQPESVFLADIRGNGDEEIFFLRNYPEESEGPRLIMRDDWGDDSNQNEDLIEWALMDNGDKNEFRAGAGGDVDGDGKDEVILLRDDRIRVYHRPENGNEGSSNYVDHMLNTDNERINLLAGDLDRNGFTSGPILVVSANAVNATLPAGTISPDFNIQVTNVGTAEGIGISISQPSQSWAKVRSLLVTTPGTIRVYFDATSLSPGQYSTSITLRATQGSVQNDNFVIDLNLTVVPPVLQPRPSTLSMLRPPCEADPCSADEIAERNEPFTSTIRINGSSDLSFRAAILGVPDQEAGMASAAVSGLVGPITGGAIDDNGNIIIYDDLGNSRTLGGEQVSTAAALSTTLLIDPLVTWITTATLDSNIVPANLSIGFDPSILTEDIQSEYAVLVLVADTRAGTPNQNVTLVPIHLANVGHLLWGVYLSK
jgi:hypothetical protein